MNSGFPAGWVDLDRLRRGPVEWSGGLPAESGVWGLEELGVVESSRLTYRAEPGGHGGVRVVGCLTTTLHAQCRRCLSETRWPVEIDFDFRFDPTVQESEEEGGVFALDSHAASLDLVRPLREELVLALPEYPVCRDGCLGLCPICGDDLNESACGCRRVQVDPRWDVLRELVSDGQLGAAEAADQDDGNEG